MNICDHGLPNTSCPLCPKAAPPVAAEPVGQLAHNIADAAATPLPKQEFTDPTARYVVRLADEYAKAQDDVSVLRSRVKEYETLLAESEHKLGKARDLCVTKQAELLAAIQGDK